MIQVTLLILLNRVFGYGEEQMNKEKMNYMKTEIKNYNKIVRAELLFTPLLIALPLFVGVFLIYDWYIRGFSANNSAFTGQLMLGIIILIGNILFDIPFVKSLVKSLILLSKSNK